MFDFSSTIKTDALLLDVDGTLWDSTSIVAKAWNKAARETGFEDLNVEPDVLKGLFGKTMDEIAYALVPGASKEKRDELMDRCVIYEQQALEEDPCRICYPGVIDTIKYLSERLPLAIVSNCQSGYIELFMKKTVLTSREIHDKECFGDTGNGKTLNILSVMERNGYKKAYYVGDTEGDRIAVREAGIGFISADYGFGDPSEADIRIDRFDRLREIIEN
ncbi:MAG: HAD family hydrolase [Lachnospiraceae bacterium]|nr:HAD family hydrolase [Lachnospiraceae bacterium]